MRLTRAPDGRQEQIFGAFMLDRNNTIAGWALFSGIVALGLGSLSGHYFLADKTERPEKMGYEIEGVVSSEGGEAAAEAPIEARLATGVHDAHALAELVARLGQSIPNSSKEPPLVWLTASAGAETRLIMVEDIAYFQSDTKYTVVMTAAGEALLRKPIRELLDVLDPAIFKQIHRSTIVNLRAVASITRDESGRGLVKLKTRPETLSVSQPFMSLFRNM